ncbi:MAG: rRNA maturation RNase YbeY [Epsilonproteobacteria bacterium]|nr:rRNA maturation RNase YbeY [Campylobacterota bacterium]
MILLDDRYGYMFTKEQLETIKVVLTEKEVELILMDDDAIAQINAEFRGKDCATDVLSFPLEDMPHSPLGTIIISVDRAKAKAEELGHSVDAELTLLFIHGLLHLMGYDHEEDEGEMRQKEEALIKAYNLPISLIQRSE